MNRAVLFTCAVVAGLLLFAATAAAQSMDDLFDDPESGIVEDEESEEEAEGGEAGGSDGGSGGGDRGGSGDQSGDGLSGGVNIDSLTTSPPQFSGSVSSSAGILLGFEEWPGSEAADGRSAGDLLRGTGLYDMSTTLKVDARPHPSLRFLGSLKSELDEERMRFTAPSVGELFVDYTLGQNLFFRAGKQNLTWGEARLLGNPANLVDRLSDGVAIRASYPVGPGSVTGAVYSIQSWVQEHRPGSWRSFAYAGLYETTIFGITAQLASHFKSGELTDSAASLSFGAGPVDLTFEGLGRWDYEEPLDGVQEWGALAQAFWERDNWSLLGEYEFDSIVAEDAGHYVGVGVQMPRFGKAGWRPRLRWRHAFRDDSGEIAPTISGTVAPKMTATIGLPVVYGEPGTHYREAEDDSGEGISRPIPGDDIVSVQLGVSLNFSF